MASGLEDKMYKVSGEIAKRPEIVKGCLVQNFTTKKFCREYDICEEGYPDLDKLRDRGPTNKELPNFFQTIYHAGTVSQFFKYTVEPTFEKYDNVEGETFPFPVVINESSLNKTFHYLFDVLKKGVYVQIKDNALKVFLPFSNTHYRNDWGKNLRTRSRMSVVELQEMKNKKQYSKPKYMTKINKDINGWYANYCIFRNSVYKNGKLENLDDEGDKSIINFLELLTELCYNRKIPDVCFFISPRDFPVVKKNLTHPYELLYPPLKVPDLSKKYNFFSGYIPVFSQSITSNYSDTLIPTDDDIKNLLCKSSKTEIIQRSWSKKIKKAVFRGSATGCGITEDSNPRLKLVKLSEKYPELIDAKLTGLNKKLKLDPILGYVDVINDKKFRASNKNRLTSGQQSVFKYIIHVQGHVAAFRLTNELSYGSLIIKVDTPWKTWYSDMLVGYRPFVDNDSLKRKAHYVIVKEDLSNLVDVIKWCKENDNTCKRIASRSYKFYEEHFKTPDFMFNYMQKQLVNISRVATKTSESKGLIIIPYRNTADNVRKNQLDKLTKFIDKNVKMDYVVTEQKDGNLFNKGLLVNKAYIENPGYDYYIFQDVDLIPDEKLIKHYYEYPNVPIHLGYRGQRYSQKVKKDEKLHFLGGVLSINKYDFETINGFPNNFEGWGGEDDALKNRLHKNGIYAKYPVDGAVIDLEKMNLGEKMKKLRETNSKNKKKKEQIKEDLKFWFKNGLNELN